MVTGSDSVHLKHPNREAAGSSVLRSVCRERGQDPNLSHPPLWANQGGIWLNVLLIPLDQRLVALLAGSFLRLLLTEQLVVVNEGFGASRRFWNHGINICQRQQSPLLKEGPRPWAIGWGAQPDDPALTSTSAELRKSSRASWSDTSVTVIWSRMFMLDSPGSANTERSGWVLVTAASDRSRVQEPSRCHVRPSL